MPDNEDRIIDHVKILLSYFTVEDSESYECKLEGVLSLRDMILKDELSRIKLKELLYNNDGAIRILSAETLSKSKSFPEEAIPVLQTVLDVCRENDLIKDHKDWIRVAIGSLVNYEYKSVIAEKSIWPYIYTQSDLNLQLYAIKAISKIAKVSDASWTILCLLCKHEDENIRDFSIEIMESDEFKDYIRN